MSGQKKARIKEETMHPLILRELVDDRVREVHREAAARERVKLARQARRGRGAAAAVAHPVATLRSRHAIRGEHPGQLAAGHESRRAA